MTIYTKPAVRSTWGQTATPSDLQDPGNTYASAGWQIGLKPPRQYVNWVLNYVFTGIRYLCQQGIPNWDATETYPLAGTTLSPSGLLYRSIANSNIGQNPDNSLFSWWDIPYVAQAQAGDRTVRIANTAWVGAYFIPVGATFTAINGQISNAQVPVGAVTQWQGSLTLAGSQVASAVAQANKLLLNGAGYATFNWNGIGGQPSWLLGSNDGVNFNVYNASNFSVANSQALQGLSPAVAASGNSIVQRDASGYIYGGYFNQSSNNNENGSISQVMITNGGDNFLRKAGFSYLASQLISQNGLLTSANFAFSSGGWQKIGPNSGIVQGGRVSVSGVTNVFFPLAFPHACLGISFTNEGSTNQIFLNTPPNASFFQTNNGSAIINYVAFGW